jgi:hypothetical protein
MVRKQILLATLTLASLAVVNGQEQIAEQGSPDPYLKY